MQTVTIKDSEATPTTTFKDIVEQEYFLHKEMLFLKITPSYNYKTSLKFNAVKCCNGLSLEFESHELAKKVSKVDITYSE